VDLPDTGELLMRRDRVLLISIVDYSSQNGGGLWATSLVESVARVPDADFVVVSIGNPATSAANDRFVRSLGLEHVFVPFRAEPSLRRGGALGRRAFEALGVLLDKYYFEWERKARRQRHVDAEVRRIIDAQRPDLIVVSYLYSALFAPSVFRSQLPVSLVTLNREAQFHESLSLFGGPTGRGLPDRVGRWVSRRFNWVANRRVAAYEKRIHDRCAGIAVLTSNDLPANLPNRIAKAVLPPFFKQSVRRWSYRATRRLFFVGNIGHYPNRLAVEWLCTRFATALLRCDATIQIGIIGAAAEQVPAAWLSPNVRFMGYADKAQVVEQMTSADLFIAPIANQFGAKIKLAECIAHGMPFIATEAAMSGLPPLGVPHIALEQPAEAAAVAARYINAPETLAQLSESVTSQVEQARAREPAAWSSFIRRSIETHQAQGVPTPSAAQQEVQPERQ
jgi:glycosyltransferase involved in cell wall biosynthesis